MGKEKAGSEGDGGGTDDVFAKPAAPAAGADDGGDGGDDGSQDQGDEALKDGVDGGEGGSDSDGEGKGGEDGGGGEGHEGADGGKEDAPVSLTEEQIDAIVEKRLQERDEAARAKGGDTPRELSEEEWAKKEEEWGGASRKTIQAVAGMQMKLYTTLTKHIDDVLSKRLGKIERSDAITSLSKEKGFADVLSLRPGIEEFMKDFPPEAHSNPALLKKAAIYARGLGAAGRIDKARSSGERNRRIVGAGRPSAPSSPGKGKVSGQPLTAVQREAAKLHPGGEAGYRKDRENRNKALFA